jgi:ABC-type bacteriocin/lantibiotic exporter with double-glycine peptidase domain
VLLAERPELENTTEYKANEILGNVNFREVEFAYIKEKPLLKGITFSVSRGQFIALVGASGVGKTTCLRLILALEARTAGEILIDGHSIDSLDIRVLRSQIGVVLQNSQPLVGDIYHNIVGASNLSVTDAWEAASLVGLADDIEALPMGMFTHINHHGVSFSGGQLQCLFLARALVKKPRLVLLDEATSALDSKTQALITANIERLNITRIIVAHRPSTIKNADKVYVLHEGVVGECGCYEELLRMKGIFAGLIKRQSNI